MCCQKERKKERKISAERERMERIFVELAFLVHMHVTGRWNPSEKNLHRNWDNTLGSAWDLRWISGKMSWGKSASLWFRLPRCLHSACKRTLQDFWTTKGGKYKSPVLHVYRSATSIYHVWGLKCWLDLMRKNSRGPRDRDIKKNTAMWRVDGNYQRGIGLVASNLVFFFLSWITLHFQSSDVNTHTKSIPVMNSTVLLAFLLSFPCAKRTQDTRRRSLLQKTKKHTNDIVLCLAAPTALRTSRKRCIIWLYILAALQSLGWINFYENLKSAQNSMKHPDPERKQQNVQRWENKFCWKKNGKEN